MKKLMVCLILISVLVLTGCEKVEKGKYKEGTYFGTAIDTYGGKKNIASAVVYVNENGKIASVFIDTTYQVDDAITTKKTLGNDYGMKRNPKAKLEWFEQMEKLENFVLSNQGLEGIQFTDSDNSITDSVSGVTIKIDSIYKALDNAIKSAK